METGLYLVLGKLFVWGCVAWIFYRLVAYVLERAFNIIFDRIKLTYYFTEFLVHREDFNKFTKNKGKLVPVGEIHPIEFGRWILKYTNHCWDEDLMLCHNYNNKEYTTAELYKKFLEFNEISKKSNSSL